jgi:hypothetical protein
MPLKTRVAILSWENYRRSKKIDFSAKIMVRLAKFPQFKEYFAKQENLQDREE